MKIGGHEINNWYIVGGAAAVLGGYLYWRHEANSSASSATSTSSSSGIDPVTGLPYSEDNSIDPATGLSYLSEAEEYGSVQAAEEQITSGSAYYGNVGSASEVDSGYPTTVSTSTTTGSTATTYATNAQWASAVQAGLVGIGYSQTDVASALGLFFAQHPLSAAQANIIQVAEAEYGPPPQGTYSIIPEPTPPADDVTVPNVVGLDADTAGKDLDKAGLTHAGNLEAPGRTGYSRKVYSQDPKAGSKVAKQSYVHVDWHYVKNTK